MIVLDTNVLSEVIKPGPSDRVLRWWVNQGSESLFVSTITQAEMLLGAELLPQGKRKTKLIESIESLFLVDLRGHILPFDIEAARIYAQLAAAREKMGRRIAQSDAMIAAIVRSQNATLATRNIADFENCGIRLINPWAG
jgi:predicted nucleic acid-binding protein